MNAENILNALNDIPDRRVRDAEAPVRPRRAVRPLAAIAAVLVLCLVLTVPAAAYTDTGYAILYDFSPTVAQALKPVNESCEANGVRMTVDSAVIENGVGLVKLSLQDLEGGRLDGTTDLFDSYSLRYPHSFFDCSGGCEALGYDDETHTVSFLIQLAHLDGKMLRPGKVTLEVRELLSHKQETDGPLDLDLRQAETDPNLQTGPRFRGAGGGEEGSFPEDYEDRAYLVPGDPLYTVGDGAAVTAMGWIDGRLHIQLHYEDIITRDDHGYLYLTDASGGQKGYTYSVSFWDEEETGSYEDYVFDLSPDEASRYALNGHFWLGADRVEGPWEVTFRLE